MIAVRTINSKLASTGRSYTEADVISPLVASCTVPARDAGMRVVEVAMAEGGEMSHSGVQVEYVGAGSVSSVFPASGVVACGEFSGKF